MSITIKRYQKNLESEWDNFVLNSNNGTLFHYRNFLNYQQKRSFCDHSLIFYWKNKLCAILPAAEDLTNGKKIYYSHPGASFGGIVYEKPSFEIFQQIILSFEGYLKENQFNEIFLVQTPVLYGEFFDESIKVAEQCINDMNQKEHDSVCSDCSLASHQLLQASGGNIKSVHPILSLYKAYGF